MFKTYPVSVSMEGHGLAGSMAVPEGADDQHPMPGVAIIAGPGPTALARVAPDGTKQWPAQWLNGLGAAGLSALFCDQRGSGESTGEYYEATRDDLYEEARAAADMLAIQPEVSRVGAIAWGEGTGFALQLAAEGKVDALVLLAPGFLLAEARYAVGITKLAARNGLSDRVVQMRINQWRAEAAAVAKRVEQGEQIAASNFNGQMVLTNLVRFVQSNQFDPAQVAAQVRVPVLILHGEADAIIPPEESEQLAQALQGPVERRLYPGEGHFLFRSPQALADAAAWLKQQLV